MRGAVLCFSGSRTTGRRVPSICTYRIGTASPTTIGRSDRTARWTSYRSRAAIFSPRASAIRCTALQERSPCFRCPVSHRRGIGPYGNAGTSSMATARPPCRRPSGHTAPGYGIGQRCGESFAVDFVGEAQIRTVNRRARSMAVTTELSATNRSATAGNPKVCTSAPHTHGATPTARTEHSSRGICYNQVSPVALSSNG